MKSCSKFSDHHIPLVLVMMKQATLSIPTKYRRQLWLKLSFIYSHTYTILPPLSPLIGKCKKSYNYLTPTRLIFEHFWKIRKISKNWCWTCKKSGTSLKMLTIPCKMTAAPCKILVALHINEFYEIRYKKLRNKKW